MVEQFAAARRSSGGVVPLAVRGLPWHLLPVLVAAFLAVLHAAALLSVESQAPWFAPDFGVFWTAADLAPEHPELLYDPEAVTRAQSWLAPGDDKPRPWAYPPTTLLLVLPLAWLPFWTSYAVWVAAGLASVLLVTWRWVRPAPGGAGLLLLVGTPPVLLAAVSGQTTLALAPLVLAGLAQLPRRPVLAGALLGVALVVKPQLLVLTPVALLAGRHLRALAAALAAALVLVLASVAALGWQPWEDWLRALPRFLVIVEEMGLQRRGLTLHAWAEERGLAGPAAVALRAASAVLGLGLVVRVFRRRTDLLGRGVALVAGGLLCSSYAMPYEAALLAPAAVAVLAAAAGVVSPVQRVTAIGVSLHLLGPLGPLAFALSVCLGRPPGPVTRPGDASRDGAAAVPGPGMLGTWTPTRS